MGIIQKKKLYSNLIKNAHFIQVQGYWGHNKKNLDLLSNNNLLGFKENFCVINPNISTEYTTRVSKFCYNLVLSGGNILFYASNNDNDEDMRNIIKFFGLRGLQPILSNWYVGNITNNKMGFKNTSVVLLPSADKNVFILKEAFKKLVPVITIKDTNASIDKTFHPLISNDDSIEIYYYYYYLLSNIIIKAYLLKYGKLLIKKN